MSNTVIPSLNSNLDDTLAIWFYRNFVDVKPNVIQGHLSFNDIIKANNLAIEIKPEQQPCTQSLFTYDTNTITIFKQSKVRSKALITHIRNAFCHNNIEINNGNIRFFDRLTHFKNGDKITDSKFAFSHITCIGEISIAELQQLMQLFYNS